MGSSSSHSEDIAVIGLRGFPHVQGGTEVHCQHLYPRMKADGVMLRVYRRKPYLNEQALKANYPNIRFIDLPSTRIKGVEAVLHTFLCVIHIAFHRRPVAVHIHNIGPGMFTPLLRLLGLRVVLTYHSPNYEHSKWGPAAKALLRASEWLALKWANKVVWVNRFQMMKTARAALHKSVYIPNGIEKPTPTDSTSFLDANGLSPKQYLLAVGRLTPEKGFEHLVAAAQLMRHPLTVAIAGGSDHGDDYRKKLLDLDKAGRVKLLGVADGKQLNQLYHNAAVFVLSSVNEGFPLVMLEAMSHSLPMVVSDIPATRLVALEEQCYVPPAQPQQLAEALDTMLDNISHTPRMGYDLSQFDWDRIASTTAALYQG